MMHRAAVPASGDPIFRTSVPLLLSLLLLAGALPVAADAADRCLRTPDGGETCVAQSGACVGVSHEPPWTDSGEAAGQCPDAQVGAQGALVCEEAWAYHVTIAGPQGAWGTTCVLVYEDAYGRTCAQLRHTDHLHGNDVESRPVCLDPRSLA